MSNVQKRKPNGLNRKYFAFDRLKKVFGSRDFALLPVRIFGFCVGVMPFTFIVEPGNSRASPNIPSTFLAIASVLYYAYCATRLIFFQHWFKTGSSRLAVIHEIGSLTNFSLGFVMVIFTSFSLIASRHADAWTMELLTDLDNLFSEICEENDFTNTTLNIFLNLGVFSLLQIGHILLYTGLSKDKDFIYLIHGIFFVAAYVPIAISCTTLIIFRSYVCLLTENTKGLNRLLLNMLTKYIVANSEPNSFPEVYSERALHNEPLYFMYLESQDYSKRLNILIKNHDKICDCADNINRAYGFRNLSVITYGFVATLSCLFNALVLGLSWKGRRNRMDRHYLETNWILLHLSQYIGYSFVFYYAVKSCEDCYTETKETAAIVSRLSIQEGDENSKHTLLQFSITLLNRPPLFTASGIFTLDASLILRMISTTATYMTVLYQFAIAYLEVGEKTAVVTDLEIPG